MPNKLKEIKDPELLSQLEGDSGSKEITDPELLSQLEGVPLKKKESKLSPFISAPATISAQESVSETPSGSKTDFEFQMAEPTEAKAPEAIGTGTGGEPIVGTAPQTKRDFGAMDGFLNAVDRGMKEGEVADILALGRAPSKDELRRIAQLKKEQLGLLSTKLSDDFKKSTTVKDQVKILTSSTTAAAEVLSQYVAESMAAMLRHGYSRALAGAAEGAVVGAIGGPPGAIAGSGLGILAGMTMSNYNLETANSILESLQESGIDITNEESLIKGFEDKDKIEVAREYALKRAVPIAIFDLVSAGVGGKILGKPAKSVLSKALKTGGEVGVQSTLAGSGEAAAQIVSTGKIKPTEIFAEMIAETAGGAPEIAVGTMIEKTKNNESIKKDIASTDIKKEVFDEMVDISEGVGEITPQQADGIKNEYDLVQRAKTKTPEELKTNIDVIESVANKEGLQDQLNAVVAEEGLSDPSFKPVYDKKKADIQAKIDDESAKINNQIKPEGDGKKEETKEAKILKAEEGKGVKEVAPAAELSEEDIKLLSPEQQDEYEIAKELGDEEIINQLKTEINAKRTGTEAQEPSGEEKLVGEEEGRIRVRDDEKDRMGAEQPKEAEQEPEKKLEEAGKISDVDYVKKLEDEGLFASAGQVLEQRVDFNMPTKELKKGLEDIRKGKDSAPARKILDIVKDIQKTGEIPIIRGTGGKSRKTNMPVSEWERLIKEEPGISAPNEEQIANQVSDDLSEVIDNFGFTHDNVEEIGKAWGFDKKDIETVKNYLKDEQKAEAVSGVQETTPEGEKPSETKGITEEGEPTADDLIKEDIAAILPKKLTTSKKEFVRGENIPLSQQGEKSVKKVLFGEREKSLKESLFNAIKEPTKENYNKFYDAFSDAYENPYKGSKGTKQVWNDIHSAFPELETAKESSLSAGLKSAAEALRKGKLGDDVIMSGVPFTKEVINGAIEIAAKALEGGARVTEAIRQAIVYIRSTDWYKNLSDENKKTAEKEAIKTISEKSKTKFKEEKEEVLPEDKKKLAEKAKEVFKKQEQDREKLRKPFLTAVKNKLMKGLIDSKALLRSELTKAGAVEAMMRKDLIKGSPAQAKKEYSKYRKEIFDGLKSEEENELNNFIQAKRIIAIDEKYDATGKKRIKHPGDTNLETSQAYLDDLKESNPELYEKLNKRSGSYFAAMKDLLRQKFEEGRIDKDTYERLSSWDYSPRVFMDHLLDSEQKPKGSMGAQSVSKTDIKSLDEGSVNSLYNNARWLLENHTLSTHKVIFENKANRALYEFVKDNPENGFAKIQEETGINKEAGQPTYEEAPAGYSQVQFFEDGKRKSLIMKNELANEWLGSDPILRAGVGNIIRLLTGGTFLRAFATGINPAFALANVPKDIAHTLFFTDVYSPNLAKAVGQIGKDIINVSKDVFKRSGTLDEFIEEGGGMDLLTHQGKPLTTNAIPETKMGRGLETFNHVAGYINETSELLVRVAIRERELNKGIDKFKKENNREPDKKELEKIKAEATNSARRVMDFSQGGEWAKFADNFIPYLNAGFQAARVGARYIKTSPKNFAAKMAQAGAIVTAATLYNTDYEEWKDIPDYVKASNHILMLPFSYKDKDGRTRRRYLSIPKSQESTPFLGFFENMAEFIKTGTYPTKKSVKELEHVIPNIDPRSVPMVDAMYTYGSNFDRFKGQQVWKGRNVEPEAEYTAKTPKFFKDLGQLAGMSPERLKAATSKVLTSPDNNIFFQIFAKPYNLITEGMSGKEKDELGKSFSDHLEDVLKPIYSKYMKETDPSKKSDIMDRYSKEEETRKKLQDDKVKEFISQYTPDTKEQSDKNFKKWKAGLGREERIRVKDRYAEGKKNKGVDYWYIDLKYQKSPEVKARAYYEEWKDASEEEKKEMDATVKKLGIKTPRFNSEFRKLKSAYSK